MLIFTLRLFSMTKIGYQQYQKTLKKNKQQERSAVGLDFIVVVQYSDKV